jgi:hypothetical protein
MHLLCLPPAHLQSNDNSQSVVLGVRSYDQVLGGEHAQAMLQAMTAMRTILFVGCGDGLEDPNLGALL